VVEALGSDGNNDGIIDFYFDSDGDGFSNDVDGDSDNDGTAENAASALIVTGADAGGDGQPDSYPRANTDKMGLPNPYDLDADGDGILDSRESGLADTNNDGIADGTLGADGWSDAVDALAAPLPLTDSDLPDRLTTSISILMTMATIMLKDRLPGIKCRRALMLRRWY
jgi:hypothetical protein